VIGAVSKPGQRSFDGDEDLDTSLAEEFGKFRSKESWQELAAHMDLVLEVQDSVRRVRGPHSSPPVMMW